MNRVLLCLAALVLLCCGVYADGPTPKPADKTTVGTHQTEQVLVEGEKRFHANCSRCHQAPHKLSPRMMATAIRHMRVRANLTDEDMRYILNYMAQ